MSDKSQQCIFLTYDLDPPPPCAVKPQSRTFRLEALFKNWSYENAVQMLWGIHTKPSEIHRFLILICGKNLNNTLCFLSLPQSRGFGVVHKRDQKRIHSCLLAKILVGAMDVLLFALNKTTTSLSSRVLFGQKFDIRIQHLMEEKVIGGGGRGESRHPTINDGGVGCFARLCGPPFCDFAFTRTSGFLAWVVLVVGLWWGRVVTFLFSEYFFLHEGPEWKTGNRGRGGYVSSSIAHIY